MTIAVSSLKPAEVYDRKFAPALFNPWGPKVAGIAGVADGMSVLDVGCGTGALTLAVERSVGTNGEVFGLDANPEMLAVARVKPTRITWVDGVAEDLPFEDDRFDAVVSQFAFMFFEDRAAALREILRVLKPGGRAAVAVCGDVETSPGYSAFAGLLDRLFGKEVGDAFRAPFVLGGAGALERIADEAGLQGASVIEREGLVSFSSIEELVSTERACVWTLGGMLSDEQFQALLQNSHEALKPFTDRAGTVSFDMPARVLVFGKS